MINLLEAKFYALKEQSKNTISAYEKYKEALNLKKQLENEVLPITLGEVMAECQRLSQNPEFSIDATSKLHYSATYRELVEFKEQQSEARDRWLKKNYAIISLSINGQKIFFKEKHNLSEEEIANIRVQDLAFYYVSGSSYFKNCNMLKPFTVGDVCEIKDNAEEQVPEEQLLYQAIENCYNRYLSQNQQDSPEMGDE